MGAGWGFTPGCRPDGDGSIRDPRNEDSVASEPTTGGPVDFSWRPEGCVCYIREDVEYGDVITTPPGGCPVHRPRTLDEVMAEVAQQVTEDVLWPGLAALGIEDPTRYRLAIDTTPLTLTPNEADGHRAEPSTAVPASD